MDIEVKSGIVPVRVPDGPTRKNLVIVAAGKNSLHTKWPKDLSEKERNWDLALTCYDDAEPTDDTADLIVRQKGYKYDCVARMLQLWPWIFEYQHIWLCDDDIMTCWSDIQRMFDLAEAYHLDLAQPALSKDSSTAHNFCCVRPEYILRYTNFVEVMVPLFSSQALRKCQPTMDVSPTGLKLDWLWPTLLGNPNNRIAILDDVQIHHTREVGTSAMWDKIRAAGPALEEHLNAYLRQHHADPARSVYKIYGYILKKAVSGLPQQRTFEYPMEKRLSRRLTPLLEKMLACPLPPQWKQAPVWQTNQIWNNEAPKALQIPMLSKDNWCLSLGLAFQVDSISPAAQNDTTAKTFFYVGESPENAQFALELVPYIPGVPMQGITVACTVRGQQKYAIRKGFSGIPYHQGCHLSIQIYPQAGWISLWINHIPCKDIWCDPFTWYDAEHVHIGHEAIQGIIRNVWVSPTPAEEQA